MPSKLKGAEKECVKQTEHLLLCYSLQTFLFHKSEVYCFHSLYPLSVFKSDKTDPYIMHISFQLLHNKQDLVLCIALQKSSHPLNPFITFHQVSTTNINQQHKATNHCEAETSDRWF
ncbi:hypothetical protein GOODEAATRI_006570 [Goodea atripinnis]|uniref:Uncharacterized protein n=1 Tax=Goodea atripinnis TaxID=208336 RepID=A0ABV0NSD2_9TELE